jgi:hypothetical protein
VEVPLQFPADGVFTSSNAGATWVPTTGQQVAAGTIQVGELNNAKLSVSADTSRVWSALLKNGVVNDISYSDDQGATWNHVDTVETKESNNDIEGLNPRKKPGSQGEIHFALLASPTNKDEIYVGGDRQDGPFPNCIGAVKKTSAVGCFEVMLPCLLVLATLHHSYHRRNGST